MPKSHNRICSTHFVGNKKSNDPQSPSYVPSIFPKAYKITKCNHKQQLERYNRAANKKKMDLSKNVPDAVSSGDFIFPENTSQMSSVNVSIQVCFDVDDNQDFTFHCSFEGNNVSTQASIPLTSNSNLNFTKCKLSDKACGVDSSNSLSCLSCEAFHGFESIKTENALKDLTGTTFPIFNILLKLMPPSKRFSITKENELLLFLMKLKLGITYSALSVMFGIHRTTVTRIFSDVLTTLSTKTKDFIFWPSKKTISDLLPEAFKKNYPHCRCIIDCTEIRVEQPNTVEQRVYLYSRYKGGYTIKFLVAITPNGMVSFVSKCYGGRSSDSFITNDCGFLSLLEPGDEVMADKGFPGIKTNCDQQNAILIMPPFLYNAKFTESEVLETYNIASVRIHIERLFARVKIFGILNKVTIDLLPYIDNIVHMCCVITNMQSPIIKQ